MIFAVKRKIWIGRIQWWRKKITVIKFSNPIFEMIKITRNTFNNDDFNKQVEVVVEHLKKDCTMNLVKQQAMKSVPQSCNDDKKKLLKSHWRKQTTKQMQQQIKQQQQQHLQLQQQQ